MSTLLELRTSLRKRIGNPSDSSITDAELDAYVNKGYHHTMDRFTHSASRGEYTVTTEQGVNEYDLSTLFRAVHKVWDSTHGTALFKASPNRMFQIREMAGSTRYATPRWYYREGNTIKLFPTPAGVYDIVVYGRIKAADLVADADEPVLNDWDDVMLARAAYSYYIDIGDQPKAQWQLGVWAEETSTISTTMEEETIDYQEPGSGLAMYQRGHPMMGYRRYNNRPYGED